MMASLFFFWNILALLNASDVNLSFDEHPATKKSSVEPDSPLTDGESETETEAELDLSSGLYCADPDSPLTDIESDASKMIRCQSLSIKLPSFSTNTDQEYEECEFDDIAPKPLALKRHKSHSPTVKGVRMSGYAEEASRKSRRLQVSLSSDDLTHTYYGNVIESSHYTSIRSEVFLAKAFCNLNAADIQRLLEELNISTFSSPFHVRKAENFFGYYTVAVYDVYEDENLKYVVKFYNPDSTTFDKIRNLTEVKKIRALRKTKKMINLLPRLCFHERLGDLSLAAGANYYFSIHHAAQGELARDIFKSYASADAIHKLALKPKILETITAIGQSIGSFHCHHGLSNEFSQKSCIDYISGVAPSFNTIIHKDLHPGNIFVDLRPFAENKVTLIDLESMYVSCIKRLSNIDELNYLKVKIAEILDVESEPGFLSTLEEAYQCGIHKTYDFYCLSRPSIIVVA